jgi:CHAD domain-containing protein
LTKRANRLASAIRAAGAVYLPERLHEVRLALKKLRYVVELSAELDGQKHAADLRALKRGQDLLGRMHDLEVLVVRVRDLQASLTPPSLTAWRDLDSLLATLEDMCRRLHARYVHEREPLSAVAAKYAAVHVPPGARSERRAG